MQAKSYLWSGAGSLAALAAPFISSGAAAQPEEIPKEILAVQLRKQGFSCKKAIHAQRDPNAQYNDAVWMLTCDTGRYRMRLIPNMAAKIEKLPDQDQSPSR